MENTFRFESPFLIFIGLIVCAVVGYLLVLANRRRERDLAKLVNAQLMPGVTDSISSRRRLIRQGLWLLALLCLFIAWARPQWGIEEREVKRKGIDLVFAIDTSQSMMADDIVPNRLERAKIAITDFVDRLEGDRVALIPFAGTAFSLCPLTVDYGAFHQSLNAIDTSIIPHLGTDISTAVAEANRLFDEQKNSLRLLILITDGEDLQGEVEKALAEAQKKDMKIFTIGVGSAEGAKIPMIRNGYRDFVRDQNGQPVVTSLDETTLQKIASETGGIYAPLGQSGQGLNQIYEEKLSLVPRQEIDQKLDQVPIERYEWPLVFAIILLLVEFLLSERQRSIPWLDHILGRIKPHSVAIIAISTLSIGFAQDASETYNQGTNAYREGNFEEADRKLQQTLKNTANLELQQKAYYNLGNARYRIAQPNLQKDTKVAVETLKKSIKAFDDALQLNPDDADAKFNRDFVQKVLDQLQDKDQQDKDQQDKDQQDKDQQDKDQQDQDQQDQDQQNQDQQDQDQQDQDQQDQDQQDQDQQDQDQQDQDQQDQDQQDQDQQDQDQQDQDQQNKDQQQTQKNQSQEGLNEERSGKPEEMTAEQANQLLEALKNDEQTVIPVPNPRQYRQTVPNNTTKGKTW